MMLLVSLHNMHFGLLFLTRRFLAAPAAPAFNEAAMAQLEGMGFPAVRCQKALLATGNDNAEAAMEWLFAHMDDPGTSFAYRLVNYVLISIVRHRRTYTARLVLWRRARAFCGAGEHASRHGLHNRAGEKGVEGNGA